MTRTVKCGILVALGGMLLCAVARADNANAIVRLLNSRASGSPRAYAEAAEEVAKDAAAGKPLQGFVLAIVSQERDAPKAARLDAATREKYLNASRERIEKLARRKNNALAWYLLSIDRNDTNLLQRAAEGGNVQAQNAWGTFLTTSALAGGGSSNEVAYALKEAAGFFQKAAGVGDANGLYNLGMCYARGLGVPTNNERAFQCFRSSAEKGHPEAINNVGWFFREGRIVPKDLEMSTLWFEKSAACQNAYGEFNYGLALRRGEGIAKDVAKAVTYFKRAADGGCVEAIDAYGVALWKGEGIKKDVVRAYRYFKQAADHGYPPAMENVSMCYQRGQGVPADERKALEWKIRSRAARGDRAAQNWLSHNAK